MRTKVQKWGDSLAIRIPETFATEAQIGSDTIVELNYVEGKIILKPVARPKWTLEELLTGVNEDNLHQEIDTGPAVGNEVGFI